MLGLMAYANGQIPLTSLKKLSTPGHLRSDAAASFERLRKATGKGTTTAWQAYRNLLGQKTLFKDNYSTTPTGNEYKVWNGVKWYRRDGHPNTAVPGTSNHGWGRTVDFQGVGKYGSATFNAFAKKAKAHGWSNAEGAAVGEPWHWTYNAANDQYN